MFVKRFVEPCRNLWSLAIETCRNCTLHSLEILPSLLNLLKPRPPTITLTHTPQHPQAMPPSIQGSAAAPLKIAFLDFNLQKHKLQMGVEVVLTDTKQVEGACICFCVLCVVCCGVVWWFGVVFCVLCIRCVVYADRHQASGSDFL